MVARPDGDDCEHNSRCELCELRKSLTEFIGRQARLGERSWVLNVGGLVEALLMAASSLHEVRRERYADGTAESTAAVAASSLVEVLCELERIRDAAGGE